MQPEDAFRDTTHVSRETLARYELWHALLIKWNKRINLVAKSTLPDFWMRHALDSWQITPYLRENDRICLDFGSGAGFPGLSVAIALSDKQDIDVTLVEAAGKKASFLKTIARELALPVTVSSKRIEDLTPFPVDVITARAFAPLNRLLNYAEPFLASQTQLLLLKGASVDEELEVALKEWTFDHKPVKSLSNDEGYILMIENVRRR